MDWNRLIEAGQWQAAMCSHMSSPTWAAVIRRLLVDLDTPSAVNELIRLDEGDPFSSNVWLRLLGAAHRLVLDGAAHPLSTYLPTAGGSTDPEGAAAEFPDFVGRHSGQLADEMRTPVQTNEVMRSAPLSAAMSWLGGNLSLLEVGASAGLNLWLDRYRFVTSNAAWGPANARLVLHADFSEGTPKVDGYRVTRRRGCDRHPLDPTDAQDRRLLRSFVWPDHVDRLRRLDDALASCEEPLVEEGEAVAWLHAQLAALDEGRTVVFHSIVMPYLTVDEEQAFVHELERAGSGTDGMHRLAWVRLELAAASGEAELAVARWPEGDTYRLARLTPHATNIRWNPERLP